MLNRLGNLVVTVLLLLGAAMFLVPLAWMVSTSLKPLEQTMTIPPRWVPRTYYVDVDGRRTEAKFVTRLTEPSLRMRLPGGEVYVVSKSAATQQPDAVVLQDIPASESDPWYVLAPVGASDAADWVVQPASVAASSVDPRWANYPAAIRDMKYFWRYLANTIILCVLTITGTVLSSALVAYGFSRVQWPGRDRVFLVVLATMMIPFPVLMVPLYAMFREFGWVGTLRPLWVPAFFAGAFNVFLLRQFFMGLPRDLSEAARIDGCNEWSIFWRIVIPLSKPALLVVGLFTFMHTWNDFLGPLIFLTDQSDFTLALGLQFYQSRHGGTQWHYLMAASSLIITPVIVLFFFAQRYFVEGIALTGIKG